MSDFIPFEMQSEIMKRLPVKSLLQFRSVSKQWKSFIDNPKFIQKYHIYHPNPKHHLLVKYELDRVPTYTSIVADNTFHQLKFPLPAPELLNLLTRVLVLGSADGLVCFYGWYKDDRMVVLWNPSVRKCVGIVIPNVLNHPHGCTRIGFGVCRDTNDPTLVKINVVETPSICWEVQVFTLSSCVWKTVYTGAPFRSCDLFSDHVFIDGVIYWLSRSRGCFLPISFDLKSEKFGEVSIPERFVRTYSIWPAKVNESLGLLEFYKEGGLSVCDVWIRKHGVNQPFTKIYKVEGKIVLNTNLLVFRNNDVVSGILCDDHTTYSLEVYEPSSGYISGVGIKGDFRTFSAISYRETLLLLDQPNSIIH